MVEGPILGDRKTRAERDLGTAQIKRGTTSIRNIERIVKGIITGRQQAQDNVKNKNPSLTRGINKLGENAKANSSRESGSEAYPGVRKQITDLRVTTITPSITGHALRVTKARSKGRRLKNFRTNTQGVSSEALLKA